jgi:hypothetical protein
LPSSKASLGLETAQPNRAVADGDGRGILEKGLARLLEEQAPLLN